MHFAPQTAAVGTCQPQEQTLHLAPTYHHWTGTADVSPNYRLKSGRKVGKLNKFGKNKSKFKLKLKIQKLVQYCHIFLFEIIFPM